MAMPTEIPHKRVPSEPPTTWPLKYAEYTANKTTAAYAELPKSYKYQAQRSRRVAGIRLRCARGAALSKAISIIYTSKLEWGCCATGTSGTPPASASHAAPGAIVRVRPRGLGGPF